MTHTTTPSRIHEGRNIKRFHEMLGIKQEALEFELGDDWNQKKVSILEQKETVEQSILQQVSDVLKIPVDAFKNFDEEQAISFISNTFDNGAVGYQYNQQCTFNPIDKLLEAFEENKKLYERLLASGREKVALLERVLGER